ncbi:glutathione S-transferase [Altererythrobacter salegens]|uniref:Glutathione S-transferase n=1 Tax=Croceibacterium salegens TaxID=1737568 RepID=A0A6I4SYK3_9SPHN|nr:glutathione S-transferase family protein [Croceibacterium salegens]MXO60230.1 glutathione S-transferase [Croceibacterium salegens]
MAAFTFFYNPMSRAQIARWALHEVGADYEPVLVEWGNKPQALLDANPMGKLPTIIHHHGSHDHVVSESAAVCHYLALTHPRAELTPSEHEAADYFRWFFFAAGPLEQAATSKMFGWEMTPEREMSAGFGNYERTMDALDGWLSTHDYVCGDRFTMADVYVGSHVDWGLQFKSFPERDSFLAYAGRVQQRPAYKEAKAIDMGEIARMQGNG